MRTKKCRNNVMIVAGGSGTRMQSGIPKQFLELSGKPVLIHTIEQFIRFDEQLYFIFVVPASQSDTFEDFLVKYQFRLPHCTVVGGITRFHSVSNGLMYLPDEGLVAIHDGVRPLVRRETIERCYHEAEQHGNAIPVVPVVDSVREIWKDRSRTLDRSALCLVQTPQVFDVKQLKEAYKQEYTPDFTDDASVFERAGHKIHLVPGNVENVKITTPYDMVIAEALMKHSCTFTNIK